MSSIFTLQGVGYQVIKGIDIVTQTLFTTYKKLLNFSHRLNKSYYSYSVILFCTYKFTRVIFIFQYT